MFSIFVFSVIISSSVAMHCPKIPHWPDVSKPIVFCSFYRPDLCIGVSPGNDPQGMDDYIGLDLQVKSISNNLEKLMVDNKLEWTFKCNHHKGEYNMCLHKHPTLCVGAPHGAMNKDFLPIRQIGEAETSFFSFDLKKHEDGFLKIHLKTDRCVSISTCRKPGKCSTSDLTDFEKFDTGLYLTESRCKETTASQHWVGKEAPISHPANPHRDTPSPTVQITHAPTTKKIAATSAPTTEVSDKPKIATKPADGTKSPNSGNRSGSNIEEENDVNNTSTAKGAYFILLLVIVVPCAFVLRKRCNETDWVDKRDVYQEKGNPLVGDSICFDRQPTPFSTIPLDEESHYISV